MDSDSHLRKQIEQALDWQPSVRHHRIGVAVEDGVVTLTGEVASYAEKWNAERAVERVKGVRGIANELSVRTPGEWNDTDLALAAADALRWNVLVPSDRIKVTVEDGWLTLEGEVTWDFQRRAAERAVRGLPGIRGIAKRISLEPRVAPRDVKERIEQALKRQALFDSQRVAVEVSGSEVTLTGVARSWVERHEAEKAAWSAPGVTRVNNEILVDQVPTAA
jgi:osmotically-inducible protein OsmY